MYISGLMTGLMGYSLKKEMLGDSLFYRELQTFSYEMYSLDMQGLSPTTIQTNLTDEFKAKYSGDVNVKVFSQPADYYFPNDATRVAKYNVEVQVKSVPLSVSGVQPELATNFYKGLNGAFFVNSGARLLDFKEAYAFEVSENGNRSFSHDISFGLLSGSKSQAVAIASGIYAQDTNTTLGSDIIALIAAYFTPACVNFYNETYDTIRNTYAFSRRREIMPISVGPYVTNLIHSMDLKEDGTVDVSEKGTARGVSTFYFAQAGVESLIPTAYVRCNKFYTDYAAIINSSTSTPISLALINTPTKITRMLNRPAMAADYEVTYTNNPEFRADATTISETFDLSDIALGIFDLKHSQAFIRNKRLSTTSFGTMINNAIANSPTSAQNYVTAYDATARPMKLIKKEIVWPNRSNKGAKVVMNYNNHPKYFYTINGITYNTLDFKIAHTQPVDIATEYKVINRPNKLSVLNYAYQTERAQITVTIDAGLGRNPDEFITSFRTDIGGALFNLYNFACTLFFNEFKNIIPLAFTYYLKDVKYTYNSDAGGLQLIVIFEYSLKKYIL